MIQEIGLDVDNLSEDSMRTIFCVVVLVCAGKLSGSAPGPDSDTAPKILALARAWTQAVESGDTKA